MNTEICQIIDEYMQWGRPGVGLVRKYDSNNAGLCVQKMVEKGDWYSYLLQFDPPAQLSSFENSLAKLFNADNFFQAMASWLKGKNMKDTTVEELLTKMLLLSEEHLQSGINEKTSYQKYRAELLRRYEALEKELEDTKLYYESFVGHHEATIKVIEDLECCGNCQWSISRNCKYWQRYRDSGSYPALDSYCDKWQSDGLTREERET